MASSLGLLGDVRLRVADMRDGVLAFANEEGAVRCDPPPPVSAALLLIYVCICVYPHGGARARSYAQVLAEDGQVVGVAQARTHELFAMTAPAHAVVVWFSADASEPPPRPAELAMLLRINAW